MSCPYYDQYEEKCEVAPIVEPRLCYLNTNMKEYNCQDDSKPPHYLGCFAYQKAKDRGL